MIKFDDGLTKKENIEMAMMNYGGFTVEQMIKEYIIWKRDYMRTNSNDEVIKKKKTWGRKVRCKETGTKMTIGEAVNLVNGCVSGIRNNCFKNKNRYTKSYKGYHFRYCKK